MGYEFLSLHLCVCLSVIAFYAGWESQTLNVKKRKMYFSAIKTILKTIQAQMEFASFFPTFNATLREIATEC